MPDLALQVMASNMTSSSTVLDITGGSFYHFYEEVITALDVDVIMNVGEYLRVLFALVGTICIGETVLTVDCD